MDWMARMDDGMVRQERNPWEVLDERFGEMIGSFETMRARFREAFREGMSAAADAAAAAKAAAVAAETVALAEQVPVELAEVEQEAQEQVPLLAEGTVAGDWMVRGFLARGGSSEVYCASHRVTGAPAVLKVLWNDNPRLRERFRREREFLAGNSSPAFPALYGTGTTDGHPWIALERLDAYDPLPESEADVARYMLEIIEGVAVLHAKGLLHRDIKPANVMRRPSDGLAVLIDFGLIKPFGPESPVADSGELSVVDGQVLALGTPGYAAPEQRDGGTMSPATDVYSLGMLAERCFGGRLSRPWRRIVLKATAARPAFRYGSVEELVSAIRRRHWMARTMVALAVGAALLSACGVWVAVGG